MRTNLTLDDLGDLLEQPIVAVLATYRADGSAMLAGLISTLSFAAPRPAITAKMRRTHLSPTSQSRAS